MHVARYISEINNALPANCEVQNINAEELNNKAKLIELRKISENTDMTIISRKTNRWY